MMKKFFAMLLVAVMLLTAVAFAQDYRADDIAFSYDENAFEVTVDDVGDNDDHMVVLTGKDEAWGKTYIRFYVYMQDEGEAIATAESVKELLPDVEVTQGEWNGFSEVVMYFDGYEHIFLVPLTTGEQMTVAVYVTDTEDEEVAMARDDMISAVLDTLKIVPKTVEGSDLYTEEDIGKATEAVEAEVAGWKGIELVSLSYAGDACNTVENLEWLRSLKDKDYTEVLELLADIHTTADCKGALEPDTDYSEYQFWLARTDGGEWELVNWGY